MSSDTSTAEMLDPLKECLVLDTSTIEEFGPLK